MPRETLPQPTHLDPSDSEPRLPQRIWRRNGGKGMKTKSLPVSIPLPPFLCPKFPCRLTPVLVRAPRLFRPSPTASFQSLRCSVESDRTQTRRGNRTPQRSERRRGWQRKPLGSRRREQADRAPFGDPCLLTSAATTAAPVPSRNQTGARSSRPQRRHRNRGVGKLVRPRRCVAAAGGTPALREKSSRRARILQCWGTEKTKQSRGGIASPTGDFLEPLPFLFLLCVHRVSVVQTPVPAA